MELIIPVFIASLLGSPHCAAMCGPFVAFYAGGDTGRAPHLAYHAGRLLTYLTLGLVAGGLGGALDLAGEQLLGLQRLAAWTAALLMIGWGIVGVLRATGLASSSARRSPLHGALLQVTRRLREQPPVYRALLLGASTTLLPCGWLYAFVLSAAGTGSALRGAGSMLAFWLGTLPALVALGVAVQRLSLPLRRHLAVVSAAALILIGGLGLVRRAAFAADSHPPACHGHR